MVPDNPVKEYFKLLWIIKITCKTYNYCSPTAQNRAEGNHNDVWMRSKRSCAATNSCGARSALRAIGELPEGGAWLVLPKHIFHIFLKSSIYQPLAPLFCDYIPSTFHNSFTIFTFLFQSKNAIMTLHRNICVVGAT